MDGYHFAHPPCQYIQLPLQGSAVTNSDVRGLVMPWGRIKYRTVGGWTGAWLTLFILLKPSFVLSARHVTSLNPSEPAGPSPHPKPQTTTRKTLLHTFKTIRGKDFKIHQAFIPTFTTLTTVVSKTFDKRRRVHEKEIRVVRHVEVKICKQT